MASGSQSAAMRRFSVFVLAVTCLGLGGCAVGNVYDFRYRPPESAPEQLPPRVVVVFEVADLRKDILEGDEPLSWVGEQRGGYGNPFTVKTSDGRAFATIVQEAIVRDLEALGLDAVDAGSGIPDGDAARARAIQEGRGEGAGELGLWVKMHAYNSDTYADITVEWNFQLFLLDAAGKVIFEDTVEGERELKGSWVNPPKEAKAKVPPAFYEILRSMIVRNRDLHEAIAAASTEGGTAISGTSRCSVDQILSMKESGLTDEQIRAACGEDG